MMQQEIDVIRSNQERSLDKWVDYLTSEDAPYPVWAKYWAFTSVLKMGKFEKLEPKEGEKYGKARFKNRTNTTTSSFPLLNPRVLAKTIGAVSSLVKEKARIQKEKQKPKNERDKEKTTINVDNLSDRLSDKEFKQLLSKEKFSDLYAQFLVEIPEYSTEGLKEIGGKWVKYDQGSDPDELVESIEGYPLEWCTADPDTAEIQLQGGDFYIFYSLNEDGEAKIPRLAIRMEGYNKIAEPPRGIANDQNLDPYISPVLEEKLSDFGK